MLRSVGASIPTSTSTGTHPRTRWTSDDPRWQLDPDSAPLAATDWYAQQPLQRRIDMGRWITANTLKVTLQFEMMLIRGVVHYAGKMPNGSPVFQYLLHELIDECNHIQMFQEFVNRTGEDVPGMRRGSRFIGPILGFIGGYANIIHFIGVLCGEQPLHFQQTLQHRGAAHVPPLLNKITYISSGRGSSPHFVCRRPPGSADATRHAIEAGVVCNSFPILSPVVDRGDDRSATHFRPAVRGSAPGLQGGVLAQ